MSAPPPPPPQGPPPGGYPPPPGGGYGPPGQPGPGGQPGPYGGPNKPAFDPKTVNPLDWAILGAGALAFIFSFISYYTLSYSYRGLGGAADASDSYSAWHGFFGWFAMLLALIGSAAVAVTLFAPQLQSSIPVPLRLAGLGAYAVATLCVILALFVVPDGGLSDYPGFDSGHGFGYWVSLIVIIAGLVLSLMRFQATGGQLPGNAGSKVPNIGHYGPQGGISQGQPGQFGSHPQPGQQGQPGQYGQQPPPPQSGNPPPPPGYGPPQ